MLRAFEIDIFLILLLFSITVVSCAWSNIKSVHSVLPASLGVWTAEDEDEYYHRDTLFEYINGGAELYLTYDFKEVFVRRYTDRADSEIILEIYDMRRSAEAFGIFSIEREDESIDIGQDSEFGGGLLRFWKDRFFVSILATGDVVKAEPVMIDLAGTVDRFIESEGSRPDLVYVLPQDGLENKSIRFFHTADILNRRYFLSEKNLLHLNRQTDCLLAQYRENLRKAHLLLIRYPDSASAKKACDTFLKIYLPEAVDSGVAQLENGTWTMVKRNESLLILVSDASEKDFGMNLLAEVDLTQVNRKELPQRH